MAGYSRVKPPQSSPDNNGDVVSSLYSCPSIQNSPGGWPSVQLHSPGPSVRTLNQSDDGTYRDDILSLANFSNEDLDPSVRDSVLTVNSLALPSISPPRTPSGSSRGQYQRPSHLGNFVSAPNMVGRTTYLRNALYHMQEEGNSTGAVVDIPPNTYNRHDNNDLSSLYSLPSIQNSPGGWPSIQLHSPGPSVRTLNQSDDGTYRDDISSLANFSSEDLDPSVRDSVLTVNTALPSVSPPHTPSGSSHGQRRSPSLLVNFVPDSNVVDRTTYLRNALHQIQEKGNSTRAAVNILPDTYDRQVKNIAPPVTSRPIEEQFWMNDQHGHRKPNAEFLRDHFLQEGRLTEVQALTILRQCMGMLTAEPNVLKVKSPVTVVGDIHGQYYDLMKIFEVGGNLNETNYLFLGNYVDRGCFGIECLLYLYTLKLWHPDRIFLIRGNHECRHLTEYYTFKRECVHKYSEKVYDACIESFTALPLSGLLDGKFFCVHGGISPELNTVSDLDRIYRFKEPGSYGLLCDLLWADPAPNFGYETEPSKHPSPVPPGEMWGHNTSRGYSYYFTYEAVVRFLERNKLRGVIRGHELQDWGYHIFRNIPREKCPSLITMFSAPNYLDMHHNWGAVLKYANKGIEIRQYHARPHPFWLPNFMDAFTWSLPFVGEQIIKMLHAILSVCSREELEDDSSSSDEEAERAIMMEATSPGDAAARRQQIKNKILAVGRMQLMFQRLREEAENAPELSAGLVGADSALPIANRGGMDNLGVQGNQIRRYIHSLDDGRRLDIANERLPEYNYASRSFPYVPTPSMRQPLAAHMQRGWGAGSTTPTGEGNVTPSRRR